MSAEDAAAAMGMDAVTLEYLRKQRRAPTWALLNGDVPIYQRKAVMRWVQERGNADR